ncbi:MAG: HAD family phosphatase [Chloroflexota bacterium]
MPQRSTRAVIWDMDGVLADTAPYHFAAWQTFWQKRGIPFTDEDFKHTFGLRNDGIIRYVLKRVITPAETDEMAKEKEDSFRKLAKGKIQPLPGAVSLVKRLDKAGFKTALASSTPVENIRLVLTSLGIDGCFQAIVSGDEVAEGKPSPQSFLLAAEKLGVRPADCIVIEDAVAGVTAAKRARMRCLAVTNTHPRDSLAEADLIVASLEEVTVRDLKQLLVS